MPNRFANEQPLKPFDVTAEWLFARDDYRRPRMFIRRNNLYVRPQSICGKGPLMRKYRFLGYLQNSYKFRIVAIK
jgi:hypothetical protein